MFMPKYFSLVLEIANNETKMGDTQCGVRTCFPPSFISLWSCLSKWGKTGARTHTHTHTSTNTAYCWCKALNAGIPTMLSLREATNPPTMQPLAGSQTGQALSLKRLRSLPESCSARQKEHQQSREQGAPINEYKDGPFEYTCQGGRAGRWRGWG